MAARKGADWGLRLLCLGLAAFLWLVVFRSGSREIEVAIPVPLELVNLPSELFVAKPPQAKVEVRVRGPRRVVSRVPELELSLPLDLARAHEGETTFRLRPADLRLPERAEAVRVTPSSVPVTLEKMATARVPVRVPVKGVPQEGWSLLEVSADPGWAEVRGPRQELAGLRALECAPLNIEGAGGAVTAEVEVFLPGGSLRLVDPGLRVKATATLTRRKGS